MFFILINLLMICLPDYNRAQAVIQKSEKCTQRILPYHEYFLKACPENSISI